MPPFLQFSVNTTGRDFIVGDLHGCFLLLDKALYEVRFNASCDRLFSLGDLIDRGPESDQVLDFLSRPYVQAIQGNHEAAFIQLCKDIRIGLFAANELKASYANTFFADWIKDLDEEKLLLIGAAFETLPIGLEIETAGNGIIGLVHGDIFEPTWDDFVNKLLDQDQLTIEQALWGRSRVKRNITATLPGIDRVFLGHTVVPEIKKLGNIFAIDTGAVFISRKNHSKHATTRLTLIDLSLNEIYLSQPAKIQHPDFSVFCN